MLWNRLTRCDSGGGADCCCKSLRGPEKAADQEGEVKRAHAAGRKHFAAATAIVSGRAPFGECPAPDGRWHPMRKVEYQRDCEPRCVLIDGALSDEVFMSFDRRH